MKNKKNKRFPTILLRVAQDKLWERFLFREISRVSRAIILSLSAWIFAVIPMGFAESFPDRPTVAELEELVRLGTECVLGLNERCEATQYSADPVAYRVNPPFVRTDPAIGWYLDTNALGLIASTSRDLVPLYVNRKTVYNGSPNIAMLTVRGVWSGLQIGDSVSNFTIAWASVTNVATYGDKPLRVYRGHLVERYQVMNALGATRLSADIFERKHGSDYSGISDWITVITSAERSYENNGGGNGPYGTWDTHSAATWSEKTGEKPWPHYRPTVVRVVTGGVTIVHSGDNISKLRALEVYMSATNYHGGEIGVQNFTFDNNGLKGLTDGWVWNRVGLFWGLFQTGQKVLFLNDSGIPRRCNDPKPNTPPGAMRGYVTRSPEPEGVQRDPIGIANWWFTYCRYPL